MNRPRKWDYTSAALLFLVCLILMALRWKKLDSLLWFDPAHWLNEISRLARGEMPYRDFSFQYPPFVVFVYGWLLRLFGINFTTVQVITDAIDIVVIACCFVLIRILLPRSLHLATGCLLVGVCATSLMNFNVFSYVTYSPSLQTGAAGVFLLLFALLLYLRMRTLGRLGWALAACGGFIAVLSKPESALASLCAIVVLALITHDYLVAIRIWLVAFVPAALAYVTVANAVGLANLRAGVTGYGLATAFCPWWPTGVSLFGVLAAVGEAVFVAAVLVLPTSRRAHYRVLLYAAPLGLVTFLAYIVYQNHEALTRPNISLLVRARLVLPSVLYTSAILEPVLWVTIGIFCVLGWRLLVRRKSTPADTELLLIVTMPVVMSGRSLFSTTQSIYPEVAAICYPFLLVLGPYFLWRFLRAATNAQYAVGIVLGLMIAYTILRVGDSWSEMLSDRNYGTLATCAGTVKLRNFQTDSKVYAYVIDHTSADDYVLDVPYGGGINFATGRRCPIFNVQLCNLGVPPYYEQLDLELVRRRPPRLVIGQDEPNLGTYWGYGNKGNRACPFPRIVWAPDHPSWDPSHVMPVVTYVKDRYKVAERIGNKAIWVSKDPGYGIAESSVR